MTPLFLSRRQFLAASAAAGIAPAGRTAAEPRRFLFGACQAPDRLALLKEAGYDFLEADVAGLLMPAKPDEEFDQKTARFLPLPIPIRSCTGFFPHSIPLVGPSVDMAAIERHAATTFRRARQLGISFIVLGSGGSRKIPDGFDPARAREQFIEVGRRLGPLAEPCGVTVVLEPLNRGETNFLHTVEEGIGVVDAIAHPNVQLLADFYHMLREDEGPASIEKAGARLRHCHIAEKKDRAAPGTSGEDFRPFFHALKKIGYAGGVSIEGRWSKDLAADLRRALETMRRQAAEA